MRKSLRSELLPPPSPAVRRSPHARYWRRAYFCRDSGRGRAWLRIRRWLRSLVSLPALLLAACLAETAGQAAQLLPYGTAAGDTAVGKNDDGVFLLSWKGLGPAGSSLMMNLYDTSQGAIYLNNNGCLSFGQGISSWTTISFPVAAPGPIICPFWGDVDTRDPAGGMVWHRVEQDDADLAALSTLVASLFPDTQGFQATFAYIATWDHVGYYALHADKVNTFQTALISDGIQGYLLFIYADNGINWLLADASNGAYPQVGMTSGVDIYGINHPLARTEGLVNLPAATNVTPGIPGLLAFKMDGKTIDLVPGASSTVTGTASWGGNPWSVGSSNWSGDFTIWKNGRTATFSGTATTITLDSGVVADTVRLNTSGYSFNTSSAANSLQVNRLEAATPAHTVNFAGSIVLITNAPGAISQGTVNLRNSAVLVARRAGAVSGGTLNLRNTTRVEVHTAEALSSQTALVFDSSAGGTGGTLDLRGLGTAVGTLNSVGASGVITNSGSAPASVTVAGAADSDFRGTIQNGAAATGLTKSGPGVLTLSGTNTYSGATAVNAGTLRLGAAAALPGGSAVTIASGATLDLNGFSHTFAASTGAGTLELGAATATATFASAADATLETALTGAGHLTKTGTAALTLNAAQAFTGQTLLAGGTLRLGVDNALASSSAVFLLNGTTLDLNGHDQTVNGLDSYNAATGQFESGTVVLGGAKLTNLTAVTNNWTGSITGAGTFEKRGAFPMHWLWGTSTFSGTLAIAEGALSADAPDVLSPNANLVIASGATLWLDGQSQTAAGLSGAGTVALGTAVLTLNQTGDTTFSGEIAGSGSLVKNGGGLLVLSGIITGGGSIAVNGGEAGIHGSCASTVTVGAGARLSGSGTIAGATTVASGAVAAPGVNGVGTLTTGALTLAGSYACQLSGTTADKIVVNGDLDLSSATLVPTGTATVSPVVIATYTGTLTGGFASVPAPYAVDYSTPGQVKLVVSNYFTTFAADHTLAEGPAADSDQDGLPNLLEYALNLNPGVADAPASPLSGLTATFVKNPQAIANRDVRFIIEASDDLVSWTPVVTQSADDPGYASPTITYTLPGNQRAAFLRLKVELAP